MRGEPGPGESGDVVECARLFEQMGGAGDDAQPVRASQPHLGGPVEVDDDVVAAADDQQRGGPDKTQPWAREVGSAAAGHDGRHVVVRVGGGPQGGAGSGARPEVADWQTFGAGLVVQPGGDVEEPAGEQFSVEDVAPVGLFLDGEQVEERGA